jgi:hypothetical protein
VCLREHREERLGRHLRFGARLVKSNGDTP